MAASSGPRERLERYLSALHLSLSCKHTPQKQGKVCVNCHAAAAGMVEQAVAALGELLASTAAAPQPVALDVLLDNESVLLEEDAQGRAVLSLPEGLWTVALRRRMGRC